MYEKQDANPIDEIQTNSSTITEHDADDTPGTFDGMADWPDLDQQFHNECREILQADGITAWKDAGGCLGDDGRWTFGYPSNRGKEILADLIQSNPGILWTSTCGNTWAVLPIGEDRANSSRAFGVSHPRAVQALDLTAQISASRTLEERIRRLRDREEPWSLEDHAEFVRRSQTLLHLHAIEDAVRLLPYLRYRMRWDDSSKFALTADEAAMWLPSDEAEFDTDTLGDALEAASEIVVARIRLGRLVLGLKVVERSAAVTRFTRRRDEYRVEVSPLLIEVLDAFQAIGREEAIQ